jgi:hypothetical protein
MRVENERTVNKDLPYLRQQAHDNLQCISNKTTRKISTLYGWDEAGSQVELEYF